MALLALKLAVGPLLIGGASLAARRWGPAIAGWLVRLPLTSGPVIFFVALDQGSAFAVDVGLAVLAGGFALCAFAIAYTRAAARRGPFSELAVASVIYIVAAAVLRVVELRSLPLLLAEVGVALVATLRLLPASGGAHPVMRPPRWDLPVRIVVGTSIIVALTAVAPVLGPRASGLIATYPVYITTLTFFAHRQGGASSVIAMQRGLVLGLFGWLAFFAALLSILPVGGVGTAFVAAIVTAVAVQAASLACCGPRRNRASSLHDGSRLWMHLWLNRKAPTSTGTC